MAVLMNCGNCNVFRPTKNCPICCKPICSECLHKHITECMKDNDLEEIKIMIEAIGRMISKKEFDYYINEIREENEKANKNDRNTP